jgi:hypothetical protein
MKSLLLSVARTSVVVVTLAAAFTAAGCSGGGGYESQTVPPPTSTQISFTNWSKQTVYGQSENATPTDLDGLTFAFDGDDNADAYSDLLPTV